jgi:hypothetical protein
MDCKAKTTIRSGTIMMHSKLPVHIWYHCMFIMATTTKAVSAKDMQQRLGMKRYEPVWYMMQKIRNAMGQVNAEVKLTGIVEFDDGYFTAHKKVKDEHGHLFKSGRGSVRKQPVLVAVETIERAQSKKRKDMGKSTRAGFLRMQQLPDLTGKTYSKQAKRLLSRNAIVLTDANPVTIPLHLMYLSISLKKSNPKRPSKPCLGCTLPLAMLSAYSLEYTIIYLICGFNCT